MNDRIEIDRLIFFWNDIPTMSNIIDLFLLATSGHSGGMGRVFLCFSMILIILEHY